MNFLFVSPFFFILQFLDCNQLPLNAEQLLPFTTGLRDHIFR